VNQQEQHATLGKTMKDWITGKWGATGGEEGVREEKVRG